MSPGKIPFNVRVYGILIEENHLLVSDEFQYQTEITKFPGGGLQFGEGTHDCLKREFMEEMQLEIHIKSHYYTVDFFQPSAFDSSHQIISIYYVVEKVNNKTILVTDQKFNFVTGKNGEQHLRWIPLAEMQIDDFTFPIDQHVAKMIITNFRGEKK